MEDGGSDNPHPVIGSFMRVANNVLDGNVTNVPLLDPLLFTPASGRSKCWRHFAFRTIKGYIDKSRAICRWCMAEIKNVGNTTNLQNHLRRHHVKEVDSDDIGVGDRRSTSPSSLGHQQPAVSSPVTTALAQLTYLHNNPYNMENPRAKQVTQAILDYFISDLRPLSTIENEAFIGLFIAVDPMYSMFTLPSVTQLQHLLQEKYQVQKAVIGHTLQLAETVALVMETFELRSNEYVTLSTCFITPEWQRCSKTLQTFDTTECDTSKIENVIVQTVKDWSFMSKKISLVTKRDTKYSLNDKGSDNLTEVEQYMGFEKTLGSAASFVFLLPEVMSIVNKVRQCMTQYQHSPHVKVAIETANQHRDGQEADHMVRDNTNNWTSTLRMLQQFKRYRRALEEATKISDNEEPSLLTNVQVKRLESILEVMQPLLTVAEALCEEVLPSVALILPLYNHLLQTYSTQADRLQKKESDLEQAVATKLTAVFNEYQFNSIDTLKVATVVDPRFKGLQFMPTKSMREYAYNRAAHAASLLADTAAVSGSHTDTTSTTEPTSPSSVTSASLKGEEHDGQVSDQPSKKKIKTEVPEMSPTSSSPCSGNEISGSTSFKSRAMSTLFGTVLTKDTLKSPMEKAENEMHRYRAEEQLSLDGDPLQWWKSHEASYPLLSQLARQYLCVPATCTPPKELFSSSVDNFGSKLSSVEPHILDAMIFLNRNT